MTFIFRKNMNLRICWENMSSEVMLGIQVIFHGPWRGRQLMVNKLNCKVPLM